MSLVSPRALSLAPLLVVVALAGLACGRAQTTGSGGASATACKDYADRLCKEAGAESTTCASVKTTTELMPPEACAAAMAKVDGAIAKLGEKKKSCDTLITKLCTAIGNETATCQMIRTQTKSFPPERCDEMLAHYDEVLGEVKKMEARNKPLDAAVLAKLSAGPVPDFGPADAKVTVVEFSDFECPFCTRAAAVATQLKKEYGDKVRFVFRQFPLQMHPNAHLAAQASLAAHAQGKFWALHDAMFANQRALDRAGLEKLAAEVKLDLGKFKKALDEKTFAAAVDADMKLGAEIGVEGTPTMYVNGAAVPNATEFAPVKASIDAALAK